MHRLALLALLTGCSRDLVDTGKPPGDSGSDPVPDEDGDGYLPSEGDCDDGDPEVSPAAEEVCDGIDNDCDEGIDEGVESLFFADADADGYGDPDGLTIACEAPDGASTNNDDCDDADATVHPGAAEEDCADPIDRNCDGSVGGEDADADGWVACSDCDDTNAGVSPDATEACNTVDDDCDGATDEDGAEGEAAWYYDGDGDGYGNAAATASACDAPEGYVADATDCEDGAASVSPAGTETCDGLDNDCDGTVDEEGAGTWYADADGDGYGDASVSASACDAPAGYVATSADCDDASASVSPAAAEACDGVDNDCDGATDESGSVAFYADADGDGFGDPSVVTTGCSLPSGYASNADDCDDTDAAVTDGTVWYYDADGDGAGATSPTVTSCSRPSGYATTPDDCDDGSSSFAPSAAEVCGDGLDQDCDGDVDDDCPDVVTHCGTISSDETWEGEDTHYVTCDVYVGGTSAPLLTIEDGATVEFAPGAGLYVGWSSYGELWVDGASTGVTFTSDDTRPSAGDWDGLHFGGYDRGSWIEGATIAYGGGYGFGNIYVLYSPLVTIVDSTITDSSTSGVYVSYATVDVSGTTVADNADHGVYLFTTSALSSSGSFTGNTITGNGEYPVVLPAGSIGAVDGANTLSGNGSDAVYVHTGTVSTTTDLVALDVPWYVSGDVTIGASGAMTFTVEDGAELQFASGAGLAIGSGGYTDFVVDGASTGVTFTSARATPRAGDWDGLYVGPYAQDVRIDGATVEYGGTFGANVWIYEADAPVEITDSVISDSSTSGVYLNWGASASIHDTTIADNADYGLYVYDYASLDGDLAFTGNTVTGNDVGISLPGQDGGALGDDGTYTGNLSDDVVLVGDGITTDVTLRALDAAWHVTGDLSVGGSAHPVLTIEDGAELRFDTGAGLYVGTPSYGSVDVQGTSAGVTFTSSATSPTAGDWDGIQLSWWAEDSSFVGADIGYGGGNGYANLFVYPPGYGAGGGVVIDGCTIHDGSESGVYVSLTDEVTITDTTVRDNADHGVYLDGDSDLETVGEPTFTGNTITANGLYPVVLPATSLDQLDATSTFTGNGVDRIYVIADTVARSGTWQDLDVPYLFNGDTYLQGGTSPVVTVEPGATLSFNPAASLWIGWSTYGELRAAGTVAEPIVFTSAQTVPVAGDWDGLAFAAYDTGSVLQYVEVSYGGGYYGNVYLWGNASAVSILDATISHSASYGIYRSGTTPTISGVTYTSNTSGSLY